MDWKSVAMIAITFLQIVIAFIISDIFAKLSKLQEDKQDKDMCVKVHVDVEKSLARGDVKFAEVMAELKKFADIFLEIKLQLASVVHQLRSIEKRRMSDE